MRTGSEQVVLRLRKRRAWYPDKPASITHFFKLMEGVYNYIKYLGYDVKDIGTFEQLRQVMSIDSLKKVAIVGGFEDEIAKKRMIRAQTTARVRRFRVRERSRQRKAANRRYGNYNMNEPIVDSGKIEGIDY